MSAPAKGVKKPFKGKQAFRPGSTAMRRPPKCRKKPECPNQTICPSGSEAKSVLIEGMRPLRQWGEA